MISIVDSKLWGNGIVIDFSQATKNEKFLKFCVTVLDKVYIDYEVFIKIDKDK